MKPYYDDGKGIVIFHGDCREILPSIKNSADTVILDPPFFMPSQHYNSRSDWQRSWGDTSILASWFDGLCSQIVASMRDEANVFAFCDDESYAVFYPAVYRRFDNLAALVWDKGHFGMGSPWRHSHEFIIHGRWKESRWRGGAGESDILRVQPISSSKRLHPVDKPAELLSRLIANTTDAGDTILDPFVGGGSTLRAAKDIGRLAVGIEIEERYCEIAARRLEQEVLFT